MSYMESDVNNCLTKCLFKTGKYVGKISLLETRITSVLIKASIGAQPLEIGDAYSSPQKQKLWDIRKVE